MKLLRVFMLVSLLAIVVPSSGLNSRKLEDGNLTPSGPGVEKKCAGCSCNNSPCAEVPPPPSTKYHPPPSGDTGGSINYPNNAPPPPPPSQQYVYMPGPPGNDLYTVNPYYTKNGASPGFATFGFPAFIGSLLWGYLALS